MEKWKIIGQQVKGRDRQGGALVVEMVVEMVVVVEGKVSAVV